MAFNLGGRLAGEVKMLFTVLLTISNRVVWCDSLWPGEEAVHGLLDSHREEDESMSSRE
jgi:hypothetical protein